MRTGKILLALTILGVAGACATTAPITKKQILDVGPSAAADRVLDQFKDLLILPDRYDGLPPRFRLEERFYQLKPHGTAIRGLCESSMFVFHFDPVRAEAEDEATANSPTRLTSVKVGWPSFRVRDLPRGAEDDMTEAEKVQLNAACRDEGYNWESYFSAANAGQAFEAAWLLRAIKAQIPLASKAAMCTEKETKWCAQSYDEVLNGHPPLAEDCDASHLKTGLSCLTLAGMEGVVRAYYRGHGPDIQLDHIEIEMRMVLWHERME